MNTVTAFAVALRGELIIDTVRAEESAAREAAVRLAKQPGVGWRDLQARGFAVVAVTVAVASVRREPSPAPRFADRQPIRRRRTPASP